MIDHRLSDAELDALNTRLWDQVEAYTDKGDYAHAGGMREAIDMLISARREAFHASLKRREARRPKTIFGKTTHS